MCENGSSFHELVRGRESIRDYDPARPLSDATLTAILEAGRLAPSACNRQPWRFIVVSSPAMLAKVRPCYGRPWFQEAPHILVVVGRRDLAWTRASDGYNSLETDLTIALDHMILAAEAEGVASCWVAAYDPKVLREALALRAGDEIYSITPLGYPRAGFAKRGNKSRKPMAEVASIV
jgi:nitroreductase